MLASHRARFTLLYAAVFVASGAALLVLTFLLFEGNRSETVPAGSQNPQSGLAAAQRRIAVLEQQLTDTHQQQTRQLLAGAAVALVVMAGVSLVLGRMLARRVLRPLRVITGATRRISAESLDRRLAVSGPDDEVKDLADTIDELLERLEASFTAQRRFVANAAHELRTPLATMRASADVAVAKPDPAPGTVALADRVRLQLDRVEHLLDGFLVLARAQHGPPADTEPVDLGELIGATLAVPEDLTVTTDVAPGSVVRGNPVLLARLVENVLDNAVTHNRPGGWIAVRTSAGADRATLTVETGGPVLDQGEVDRLARPFERLGAERVGSSGLGLSIVAAIARAHGGRLVLTARPEGGLRVVVELPA
ncbi:HAMP domain-containing sensor histidine kinase [Actinoplanes sp. NPDC051861]|uniref:sensor histidine kinase n=1 Tax=Actinoplanes sp. NPDC051861 TaxID=3155170 RepID=UPI0034472D08